MKKYIVITIILLILATGIAFIAGKSQGEDIGYKNGYSQGKADGVAIQPPADYSAIEKDYNELVEDYNDLLAQAQQAQVQTQAKPQQPFACNATTYGITGQYTAINCY